MLRYLLVLFLALPFIDLYVLIELTSVIGFVRTLGLVALTGIIGAEIIRREGRNVFGKLHTSVTSEEISRNLLEIVLLVLGGLMLLSPGLITDIIGLIMVIRPTRERIMLNISEKINKNSELNIRTYSF